MKRGEFLAIHRDLHCFFLETPAIGSSSHLITHILLLLHLSAFFSSAFFFEICEEDALPFEPCLQPFFSSGYFGDRVLLLAHEPPILTGMTGVHHPIV
jgi:hypothetical protein